MTVFLRFGFCSCSGSAATCIRVPGDGKHIILFWGVSPPGASKKRQLAQCLMLGGCTFPAVFRGWPTKSIRHGVKWVCRESCSAPVMTILGSIVGCLSWYSSFTPYTRGVIHSQKCESTGNDPLLAVWAPADQADGADHTQEKGIENHLTLSNYGWNITA